MSKRSSIRKKPDSADMNQLAKSIVDILFNSCVIRLAAQQNGTASVIDRERNLIQRSARNNNLYDRAQDCTSHSTLESADSADEMRHGKPGFRISP